MGERKVSTLRSLLKAHFGFNCSLLCLYPNERVASRNAFYRFANWATMCNLSLLLLLVVCALPETNNTVDMGDDMVWIIGVSLALRRGLNASIQFALPQIALILTKMIYCHLRANEIDEVIDGFAYYDRVFRSPHNISYHSDQEEEEILRWKRICYLVESSMLISMTAMVSLFNLIISVQPLIDGKELPFHVVMPYGLHRAALHPWAHLFIYIWLVITAQLVLLAICQIDLLGLHSFLQTALNLKLLCIELSKLGNLRDDDALFHTQFCRIVQFHQHIIRCVCVEFRDLHNLFSNFSTHAAQYARTIGYSMAPSSLR